MSHAYLITGGVSGTDHVSYVQNFAYLSDAKEDGRAWLSRICRREVRRATWHHRVNDRDPLIEPVRWFATKTHQATVMVVVITRVNLSRRRRRARHLPEA